MFQVCVSLPCASAHGNSIDSSAMNDQACRIQNRRATVALERPTPSRHATTAHGHSGSVL